MTKYCPESGHHCKIIAFLSGESASFSDVLVCPGQSWFWGRRPGQNLNPDQDRTCPGFCYMSCFYPQEQYFAVFCIYNLQNLCAFGAELVPYSPSLAVSRVKYLVSHDKLILLAPFILKPQILQQKLDQICERRTKIRNFLLKWAQIADWRAPLAQL